jgi:glycosyltransferase involved in cell wall biosynthesis
VRILQICRDIKPGGGASGVAYDLEQQFQYFGHEVDRLTMNTFGIRLRSNEYNNILVKKLWFLFEVVFFTFASTFKVLKIRKNYDLTICHSDCLYGDVLVNHGLFRSSLLSSKHPVKMLLRNPVHIFTLAREFIRHYLRLYKVIVVFSEKDKLDFIEHYQVPESFFAVIPNGVDLAKYRYNPEGRSEYRKRFGLTDESKLLVFVGHEFRRKGLIHVIDALVNLPKEYVLAVAGGTTSMIDDYRKRAINQGVDDRVFFLGQLQNVTDLYSASDMFVLPSEYETWGLVGTEALSCGTPVLITDTGSVYEYLIDGVNGFFIKQDSSDIARLSLILAERPLFREELRQSVERFAWYRIAEQYLKLVERIPGPGA